MTVGQGACRWRPGRTVWPLQDAGDGAGRHSFPLLVRGVQLAGPEN